MLMRRKKTSKKETKVTRQCVPRREIFFGPLFIEAKKKINEKKNLKGIEKKLVYFIYDRRATKTTSGWKHEISHHPWFFFRFFNQKIKEPIENLVCDAPYKTKHTLNRQKSAPPTFVLFYVLDPRLLVFCYLRKKKKNSISTYGKRINISTLKFQCKRARASSNVLICIFINCNDHNNRRLFARASNVWTFYFFFNCQTQSWKKSEKLQPSFGKKNATCYSCHVIVMRCAASVTCVTQFFSEKIEVYDRKRECMKKTARKN